MSAVPVRRGPSLRCGRVLRAHRTVSPRGPRAGSPHTRNRRHHNRGRQDPSEAHGQDPCTVLPRRRHGLAHQARWPGDRGDRQVPPDRAARRSSRSTPSVRSTGSRVGAQPTEQVEALLKITGDWQKFKGLPGAEGTLQVAEPKADKRALYEAAARRRRAAPWPPKDSADHRPTQEGRRRPSEPPRRRLAGRGPGRRGRDRGRGLTVLEEALEHLVKGIVDHDDEVVVRRKELRRGELLEVRVHPDDLGRVIGRSGRTASALRTVMGALAGGRRSGSTSSTPTASASRRGHHSTTPQGACRDARPACPLRLFPTCSREAPHGRRRRADRQGPRAAR